jgi:hypothetical protein
VKNATKARCTVRGDVDYLRIVKDADEDNHQNDRDDPEPPLLVDR